jgi:hypothetical protein
MTKIEIVGTDRRAVRNFHPVIAARPMPVRLGPVAAYQQK